MSQFFDRFSYIICYRESSAERRETLDFVIILLRQNFPDIEIIIVEQDSGSKLILDKGLDIKHLFIYNSGLFNRSWAFNYATKNTNKEVFVFADADVFLEKEGYIECFEATREFEAIAPNRIEISNIAIGEDTDNQIQFLNKQKLHSFAGRMLIITRKAFEKIGGWDERFEGRGGEDDVMSHVIYNRLSSKTFKLPIFHIDHPHEIINGNNHPRYDSNEALKEEIVTRNGAALDRYIEQIKASNIGNPNKYEPIVTDKISNPKKFALAITTYNRLDYLKKCVESFFKTRTDTFSWQLIIADDGSTDGTKEYLQELEEKYKIIVIHNNRTNIHHQVNSIIKTLSTMTYDLCFKCDDDIAFLQKGWDKLYWKTIVRTGYDHLIFYDKNWQPFTNLSRPIRSGSLVANCDPEKIQGAFYTLTKEVIENVGYFDEQQFGASGLGHVDYSFRCCRAGFNVLANPFDVEDSNDFIQLQSVSNYSSASSLKAKFKSNSKSEIAFKKQQLGMDRVYIAYNSNFHEDVEGIKKSQFESKDSKKRVSKKFQKADASYYPDRGIIGFIGFVLKRIYNLSIDTRIYIIPLCIKALGKALNKISIHLINIEQ